MVKAERLSAAEFGGAVEKAVQLAAKRSGIEEIHRGLGSDYLQTPWWIVGRRVRDVELGVAHEFATGVAAKVTETTGIDVAAAITVIDGDILVGFVERFGDTLVPPVSRFGRQSFQG